MGPRISAPVVGLVLASPFDDVTVGERSVREIADGAMAGIGQVPPDRVPDDAVLVVHDRACPWVPVPFVASLVEACLSTGRPQVAVLPITDTIKVTEGPTVGQTLDRDALAVVASPLVLPPGVRPAGVDLAGLVEDLRAGHEVELVTAPAGVVRLTEPQDVAFLPDLP